MELTKEQLNEIYYEAYAEDYFKKSYEYYKIKYPKFWQSLINFDEEMMIMHNKMIYEFDDNEFKGYINLRNEYINGLILIYYGKKK